jgi:hypothetical protein
MRRQLGSNTMTIELGNAFIFEIRSGAFYARLARRDVYYSRASGVIFSAVPKCARIASPLLA